MDNKYVFIISINNGGSTMLQKILGRCRNVSDFDCEGEILARRKNSSCMRNQQCSPMEGWWSIRDQLSDPNNYDWKKIKKIWHNHWDLNKTILLQKSPRDIFRIKMLQENFHNSYFIIMVRNPYSICECARRKRSGANTFATRAKHWIECHRQQKENLILTNRNILIDYTDIVKYPIIIEKRLRSFMPGLKDVKCSGSISIKPNKKYPKEIIDLDKIQISRLSREDIISINKLLKDDIDIMEFFGYQLMDPDDPSRQFMARL